MDLALTDKTAVVIGAARGIGRAIVEAFAAEGASVALVDRDEAVVEVASEISERHPGIQVESAVTDAASESGMSDTANRLRKTFGHLDHVAFAAGIGSGKFGYPFTRVAPSDWEPVWKVNVMGAVHGAHAFRDALVESAESDPIHGASLLFLVSVAGQIGSQTDPPYSAAKAAQVNFMQCVAKDLAPHGVRANALSPGMVKTALNESVWAAGQAELPESERQDYESWASEKIQAISPLGRWQEPAEFGAAAVFLASPHARNITGQTWNIDGGQVMHA